MLSFEKLKEFLILLITFGVIYWFQIVDDRKRCKKREGVYDNIKLPLLVTAIVGLLLFWEKESLIAIFISNPEVKNEIKIPIKYENNQMSEFEKIKNVHNLDVYTDLFE
jgi:hypothetical protein